jgi:hypothetical protein
MQAEPATTPSRLFAHILMPAAPCESKPNCTGRRTHRHALPPPHHQPPPYPLPKTRQHHDARRTLEATHVDFVMVQVISLDAYLTERPGGEELPDARDHRARESAHDDAVTALEGAVGEDHVCSGTETLDDFHLSVQSRNGMMEPGDCHPRKHPPGLATMAMGIAGGGDACGDGGVSGDARCEGTEMCGCGSTGVGCVW